MFVDVDMKKVRVKRGKRGERGRKRLRRCIANWKEEEGQQHLCFLNTTITSYPSPCPCLFLIEIVCDRFCFQSVLKHLTRYSPSLRNPTAGSQRLQAGNLPSIKPPTSFTTIDTYHGAKSCIWRRPMVFPSRYATQQPIANSSLSNH